MSIEQEIENYYNNQIKKYEYEAMNAIEEVLGQVFRELYITKKDGFHLVYVVSKDGLEYNLIQDIEEDEKRLIEYLLDKIGKNEYLSITTGS